MTSSKLLFNFTAAKLKSRPSSYNMIPSVEILSVFNSKILVSRIDFSQLFIYSREGRHVSTITTEANERLWDASWTPRGNVVYATRSNTVAVMSASGKVINTTQMQIKAPRYFSISNDEIIYLSDRMEGLYQSTDDGVSWNLVFTPTDGWHFWQAIKVTTSNSDDYWIQEWNDNMKWRFGVYKRRFGGKVTWREVYVPSPDDLQLSMSYDGNMNIFFSDNKEKSVYLLLVNNQHHCQLLSSHHIKYTTKRLAVDRKRKVLYIGQDNSVLDVYELTYGNGGDLYNC